MKVITLFKGTPNELKLGPMLAATMRDNKDEIAKARTGAIEPPEMMELTTRLAYACARRVDSTITEDRVANIVDFENFSEVFSACFGVSVPEPQPGEA